MSILDKILKNRQIPPYHSSLVTLKTDKNLSEEQKQEIISIVRNRLDISYPAEIAIAIMEYTGIYEPVILTQSEKGVEISF